MKPLVILAVVAAVCAITGVAPAAEYFVDFERGNDGNAGTAPAAAFMHAPGDPAASGKAAALALAPGDVVRFKGGVHYRGSIVVTASGEEGRPVVFDGNADGAWGTGRAVIDGSDVIAGWARCTSAADAGGSPGWEHLWCARAAPGTGPLGWNLAEDDRLLSIAETPNPASPYLVTQDAYAAVAREKAGPTHIVDPRLKDWGGPALAGAFVAVYCKPNWIHFARITAFEPGTDMLCFEKHREIRDFYAEVRYAILNSVHAIDRPGEYCVDEQGSRVYLRPLTPGDVTKKTITISRRRTGIELKGAHHVTIRGFRIQQLACGLGESDGTALKGLDCSHLLIAGNEMTMNRSMSKSGVLHLTKVAHSTIEKNRLFENPFYRVMVLDGYDDSVVRDNDLDTNSGTGIVCFRTHRTRIAGNLIRRHTAVHSQGMAIYAGCGQVDIDANRVEDGTAVTVQDSLDVTIQNNVFDARGNGIVIGLWSGPKATATIAHNVLTGSAAEGWSRGLSIFSNNATPTSRFVVRQNIVDGIDGTVPGEIARNLFTQEASFRKYSGEGNALETDLTKIFVDPSHGDYRLREGGSAGGMGAGPVAPAAATGAPPRQGRSRGAGPGGAGPAS